MVRFVGAFALVFAGLPWTGAVAQESIGVDGLCQGTDHTPGQETYDERTGERTEPFSTYTMVFEVFGADVGDLVTVRVQTPSGDIVDAVGRVESDTVVSVDLPLFETGSYTPLEIHLERPVYGDDPPMEVTPVTSTPAAGILDPFEVNATESECSRGALDLPLVTDPGPIASNLVDLLGFGGEDLAASGLFLPGTEFTELDGTLLVDGVPLSECESDGSCPYAAPGTAWHADSQCDAVRFAEPSGPSTLPCDQADITAFGASLVTFGRFDGDSLLPRVNRTVVTTGPRIPQAGEEWWALWATFDGPLPPVGAFGQQLAFVGNTGLGQPFNFFDPFRWDSYQGSDLWLQLVGDPGTSTLLGQPVIWSGTEGVPADVDMVWVTVDRQIMVLVPRDQIPILQGIATSVHVHDGSFGRNPTDLSAVDSAPDVNVPGGRGPDGLAPIGPAVVISGETTPAAVTVDPGTGTETPSDTAAPVGSGTDTETETGTETETDSGTGSGTGTETGSGTENPGDLGAPATPGGGGSNAPLIIGGAILLGGAAVGGGYYFTIRRRGRVGIAPIGERSGKASWDDPTVADLTDRDTQTTYYDDVVPGYVDLEDQPFYDSADSDSTRYSSVSRTWASDSSSYSRPSKSGCLPAVLPLLLLLPLLPILAPVMVRISRRHTSGSPLRRRRMTVRDGFLSLRRETRVDGRFIYVLSRSGRFWIAPARPEGTKRPFHTDLMPIGRIAAAGEIRATAGRLTRISDSSGHFRPGAALMLQALRALSDGGVDLDDVEVVFHRWRGGPEDFVRNRRISATASRVLDHSDLAEEALAQAAAFEKTHRRSWNERRDIQLRQILDRPLRAFLS